MSKENKRGLLLAGVESAEGIHTELASFHPAVHLPCQSHLLHDIHFSLDLWSLPRMVACALLQFPIKPSDLGPGKLLRDGPSSPPPPQFHPDPATPHHFHPHPPGSSS